MTKNHIQDITQKTKDQATWTPLWCLQTFLNSAFVVSLSVLCKKKYHYFAHQEMRYIVVHLTTVSFSTWLLCKLLKEVIDFGVRASMYLTKNIKRRQSQFLTRGSTWNSFEVIITTDRYEKGMSSIFSRNRLLSKH
jgi:hypothetical protein